MQILQRAWQRAAISATALCLCASSSFVSATYPPWAHADLVQTTEQQPQQPPQQQQQRLIITPEAYNSLLRSQAIPPSPSLDQFPPLSSLTLPKQQRFTLQNGLRVILIEDTEAPLVRGNLLMKGGTRASPPDKIGLASIAAAVQRAGGSHTHPNGQLDDALEALAAAIEGNAGSDAVSFGFECLAEGEDVSTVMKLFAEVITDPEVPESKVELYKRQALNSIAHRNDNAGGIPVREAAKLIYGLDSPYAAEPTVETVSSISSDDVVSWLKTWERPDRAVLGIVGPFRSNDIKKVIEQTLGEWEIGSRDTNIVIPTPEVAGRAPQDVRGKVYFINRPGLSQASVAMADVGIQMMDEDEEALDVLGGILNSFGGRLFDDIRSRSGLAYSVSGGWATVPLDHRGLFIATAETAQPEQLIKALKQAFVQTVTTAPTEEEVANAKEQSSNSFVFSFQSNVSQLRRAVAFELLGIPQDYPFLYMKKLSSVTAGDVWSAAKRHVRPDDLVTVVIGDATKIDTRKLVVGGGDGGTVTESLKLQ